MFYAKADQNYFYHQKPDDYWMYERFLSTGFPWCMKIWTYPFLIEYIVCEAVSSTSRVNGLDSCNGRLADTLIGTFKKAALKSLANLHNIRPE